MIASLPMYPIFRNDVEVLWSAIADGLRKRGVGQVPDQLLWPLEDLIGHMRRPDLLLGQTCGYPLVKMLSGAVRVVGAFRFTAPGCDGIRYSSTVIARSDDPAQDIIAFRGRRAAYNGTESQSGYNCLRALVAPLADKGRFFGSTLKTGAHQSSMQAVAAGDADVAAIDCISFAHICAVDPVLAKALRVVCLTESVPGLPLVTHKTATDEDVAVLRAVLADVVRDSALAESRARLLIDGFEPIEFEAYAEIAAMEQRAIDAGYPILN